MKRAKIMLMSIAVLGTVGTALAFKVAKKGALTLCYEWTTVQPDHCLNETDDATIMSGTQEIIYYTTKTAPCDQLECPHTAEYMAD